MEASGYKMDILFKRYEELLNRLVLEGKTLQEIANAFQMSKNTLVTRLKEKYQMNFKEYKEYVKSKN